MLAIWSHNCDSLISVKFCLVEMLSKVNALVHYMDIKTCWCRLLRMWCCLIIFTRLSSQSSIISRSCMQFFIFFFCIGSLCTAFCLDWYTAEWIRDLRGNKPWGSMCCCSMSWRVTTSQLRAVICLRESAQMGSIAHTARGFALQFSQTWLLQADEIWPRDWKMNWCA